MPNKPVLIGVTGGIGAGKSIVCQVFNALGVPVYNADDRAKWLMRHDQDLKLKIKDQFGEEAYDRDGVLNRTYLAAKVFNDQQQLDVLNRLVHPQVGKDFELWVSGYQHKIYVIKEAALLFESGSYEQLDAIINVDAPAELRLKRVLLRDDHRTEDDVSAIMSKQFNDHKRCELADHIIINDDQKFVIPQVLAIHKRYMTG